MALKRPVILIVFVVFLLTSFLTTVFVSQGSEIATTEDVAAENLALEGVFVEELSAEFDSATNSLETTEAPFRSSELNVDDNTVFSQEETAPVVMPAATFSDDELVDPNIWYDIPDNVTTLAATPANTVYARLLAAIQAAPANQVTHIMIPFNINTGNFGTNATVVATRPGATVVLIGDHPTAAEGQITISDTHSGNISRTFRVRGNGTKESALVFRNIILQKSSPNASQSTPANPPAPLALSSQTGTNRGGGVAIENGNVAGVATGGGGHFVLCRGSVLRNTSTDNNGPVDVQTNGRFTMMPGSAIHTNAAGNSGGAVNVNTNAQFIMYGGRIYNNLARGENTSSPSMRAVGGAVLVQNAGSFIMNDGEIYQNRARLDAISAAPNALNAIVTSSGGAVFVTGTNSSFTMNGGSIYENLAARTRTSGLATGTSAAAVNNRAAYRSGDGGAVYLTAGAQFTMNGGSIERNLATNEGTVTNTALAINGLNVANGGALYLTGASTHFIMNGGSISNNLAEGTSAAPTALSGNGGGIHSHDARLTLSGGEVTDNSASSSTMAAGSVRANGGGIFLGQGARLSAQDLSIVRNQAHDGGGLFSPRTNLVNVSIAPDVRFSDNSARNGIHIDNALAEECRSQINPGRVSLFWSDETPAGSGILMPAKVHAFTNYDINSEGDDPYVLGEATTTLAITKLVTGEMGDMTRDFNFTMYLFDAEGSPLPAGRQLPFSFSTQDAAEVARDPDGVFAVAEDGSISLAIAHGQTIAIASLPAEASVRIVEEEDLEYLTSYAFNAEKEVNRGNDTGIIALEGLQSVQFENNKEMLVFTGLDLVSDSSLVFLVCVASVAAAGLLASKWAKSKAH